MKSKIYNFLIIMLFSIPALAQTYQVNGIVTDSDGQALPGVSISVKNGESGTSTDFEGNYSLDVTNGDILLFTFVGFETQEITMDGSATVNVSMAQGVELSEVVVVGSRNPNRTATETAVPVDVIDIKELITTGAQTSLNQILTYVAPSFTSNTQTISDGTDHIDPASLRGLGPDQVLVLVNGKRRHTSSLVNVNGTFGRGSVGTDLNAIPTAAIERVEVLRDGAAAQYGSDAIAGVINIVMRKSATLTVNANTGAHFSSKSGGYEQGGTDGETNGISINYGVPIGDKGGYINVTGMYDSRNPTNRMIEWEGNIFNSYNSIERVANADGFNLLALQTDFDAIQSYAQGAGLPGDVLNEVNDASTIADLQAALSADNTESELNARGQERKDYNMRVGQSGLRSGKFFFNGEVPLTEQSTLYAFGGMSVRNGDAAGFYRLPSQERAFTPVYIDGFLPEIHSSILDKSISAGIKSKIGEWNVDFSNTWGQNSFDYNIQNTSNATMQYATPVEFNAGGFAFTQNTTNFDMNKFYPDVMSGFNVAFGGEFRMERYEIFAGELGSYAKFDTDGNVWDINDPTSIEVVDFFGRARPGGSQVFPGFNPDNEVNKTRNSAAAYLDLEADITDNFLLSGALRYENYSDFGGTMNFKLATRVKLGDDFSLRASANTGFRAPSLHQLNFNSTSTIFVDGVPTDVGTFSNDSRAAKLLGIPQLKEEQSRSGSIGFTGKLPNLNLSFTVDGYFIAIDDRVVYTGQFSPSNDGSPGDELLKSLLEQANAGSATFFANAIDTESYGLDVVITHNANFRNSNLRTDFALTAGQTKQVGDIKASPVLEAAGLVDTYFDETSRIYLEKAVPRTKMNLTFNYNINKFNVMFRSVYFGKVTEATNNVDNQQVFGSKIVNDLSLSFLATESLRLTIGSSNIFDTYPDRNIEANRSSGRFEYSRRSQQFGAGGRFMFARMTFTLQ
ncbi:TonB-dependent receptor [Lutimonas vermicola]|uniref:TonB-dependent receptor n=1 Tax=Lutimonas vermicola TaxID=414288 RepID=A0ABU9KWL1_9FLAO